MVTYASGYQDNGWSYWPFRFRSRQGGNSYVDGVYYNATVLRIGRKRSAGDRHNLALTILGATDRARSAAGVDAGSYDLLSNNYYNPNVGKQDGKLRNSRVRDYHEPIVMLNYGSTFRRIPNLPPRLRSASARTVIRP